MLFGVLIPTFRLNLMYSILCLWFRASLIYVNNCPTRCNTKQSVYCSASSLYMFRVSTTPIIRSTQNCNYSLRYWSYFLCSYFPPTWPKFRVLTTPIIRSTQNCNYSLRYWSYFLCGLPPSNVAKLAWPRIRPVLDLTTLM